MTGLYGAAAHAQEAPFRTSLVTSFNPINPGGVSDNFFADLGTDGNIAALGTITGTGVIFMDITNPAAPVTRSHYNPSKTAPVSGGFFQDVAIRGNYAYCAVDDAGSTNGGIHILNIANPAAPVLSSYISTAQSGFRRNHTITLDGDYLYAASNQTPEVKVFNISNPAAPTFVRTIMTTNSSLTEHVHDTTVKNGRLYTSNISTGLLEVYDVSNVATGAPLFGSIPAAGIGIRNHSSSVSEDGKLIAIAREDTGTKDDYDVQLWDISDLAAPVRRATITGSSAGINGYTPHNPVIVGDTLYVSWYQAGLQIFNIRNPSAPVRIGSFDTHPATSGGYQGLWDGNWGVNVSRGPKQILLSDMDRGLFIVDASAALTNTWTLASDVNAWQTAANWDNGTAPMAPDGTDVVARFTNAAAGATRRVNINGGNAVRVGTIDFSADHSYTLAPAAATNGRIEMNVTSGSAAINVIAGAGGTPVGVNRIDANLELSDDLVVTNDSTKVDDSLVLGNIVATNKSVTFKGTGLTWLLGANAWTGGMVIDGGSVRGGQSRLGAGANPITIKNGGYLGFDNEGPTTTTLNAARVLNFESGVGRVEPRGLSFVHTVMANAADQIRGAGNLTKWGNGAFVIGAANPNFTGSATVSGGILDLRHASAINHRPITLKAGMLRLRGETDTDFVSSVTVAPPEIQNPLAGPSTTIHVDRIASGSNATMRLGDVTVGSGLQLNVVGNNGYRLQLDSLTNAGRVDADVPLIISGPTVLSGTSNPAFGTIGGTANVFADGGLTVTTIGRRQGTGLLRVTGPLTINPGAKLDMTTTDLLVNYAPGSSPEADLRALVKSGRDSGVGIVSSGGPASTVLAVADNAEWGKSEFGGVSIDLTTIVGKYTYFGDANLDGKVSGDDYLNVDANLGTGDSWLEGDFNMSGETTGDDYLAIDANLGLGALDPLAYAELRQEMVALHVEMFGAEYLEKLAAFEANGFAPVPEPSAAWVLSLSAAALLRRRRRLQVRAACS